MAGAEAAVDPEVGEGRAAEARFSSAAPGPEDIAQEMVPHSGTGSFLTITPPILLNPPIMLNMITQPSMVTIGKPLHQLVQALFRR